jgi:peptidylamidoglycolate lyase
MRGDRALALSALVMLCGQSIPATGDVATANTPVSRAAPGPGYRVVHGWPVLPKGRVLGNVSGCAVDSHDDVFVFHRNERTWPDSDELSIVPISLATVILFDGRTGRVLAEWGTNFFAMPHGLSVDRNDNVWLTDVALQQVFKFSHEGKLLQTIGARAIAGDDSSHFNRPTEVAVAPDGSFYVSDGYRNTRVIKFSPEGIFLFQWGSKGAGPGQFDLPHGVALDEVGRVYVSDRGNSRVQIFDPIGKYIGEWKGTYIGRPYDVAMAPRGIAVIADGGDRDDQPDAPLDRSAAVLVQRDGMIVERFGRWGNSDGQFQNAHCVAVSKNGEVYVGDTTGGRVQKFVRGGK